MHTSPLCVTASHSDMPMKLFSGTSDNSTASLFTSGNNLQDQKIAEKLIYPRQPKIDSLQDLARLSCTRMHTSCKTYIFLQVSCKMVIFLHSSNILALILHDFSTQLLLARFFQNSCLCGTSCKKFMLLVRSCNFLQGISFRSSRRLLARTS